MPPPSPSSLSPFPSSPFGFASFRPFNARLALQIVVALVVAVTTATAAVASKQTVAAVGLLHNEQLQHVQLRLE